MTIIVTESYKNLNTLKYVTESGKRYTIAHLSKSSFWHHGIELALSYKMHHSLRRQSNLL